MEIDFSCLPYLKRREPEEAKKYPLLFFPLRVNPFDGSCLVSAQEGYVVIPDLEEFLRGVDQEGKEKEKQMAQAFTQIKRTADTYLLPGQQQTVIQAEVEKIIALLSGLGLKAPERLSPKKIAKDLQDKGEEYALSYLGQKAMFACFLAKIKQIFASQPQDDWFLALLLERELSVWALIETQGVLTSFGQNGEIFRQDDQMLNQRIAFIKQIIDVVVSFLVIPQISPYVVPAKAASVVLIGWPKSQEIRKAWVSLINNSFPLQRYREELEATSCLDEVQASNFGYMLSFRVLPRIQTAQNILALVVKI